ncbi:guanine nucleotide exchange factor MUK1 KNAG_0A01990 [Huiozyma naganishii CBS 8797]|uniref:VPS9 domain-containing protein n=1 Tax=Huiozyma naganishii (strain ATCC MYA-139 / BCRC 22969 / CBS 8797 / KCTC 17520 / NBRC 10181 / NCYC 3082 / Yp74L-3) TaxID=1071383 RepID=J7REA7_HUIN7|nr:hypothetical protein KNAG_0A01990 [Kazachstania naganishii CBS 8797]CCK67888.1 hypothetical protein KNAG_0A01990 [Kazachstania naganishii CBS 8797]
MRQFCTPPISVSSYDVAESIQESYKTGDDRSMGGNKEVSVKLPVVESPSRDLPQKQDAFRSRSLSGDVALTPEEINETLQSIEELPNELLSMVEKFIADLKQPKYVRPLSILQLASLFQTFYSKFDKTSFQYLSDIPITSTGSFLNARDSLNTGLSGIFARSRSNSANTSASARARRSSSLFSVDSNPNGCLPMLSPEEINRQLRTNTLNNVRIDKYMELCEGAVFKKLLEVGTSVASPIKKSGSTQSLNLQTGKVQHMEEFNIRTLFRNTPEFIEYDNLMNERIKCLHRLATTGKLNLVKFLDIPVNMDLNNKETTEKVKTLMNKLIYYSVPPCDKIKKLLKLHKTLMVESKAMSNDEFLSMLLYYIIILKPRRIFLNEEFIKMFRYKKKLVDNEIYALTNLEAALTFLGELTLSDFSSELTSSLTRQEHHLFEQRLSERISLPSNNNKKLHRSSSSLSITENQYFESSGVGEEREKNNSYNALKTVFDSSLKNIIGKMKSYTPPTSTITVPTIDSLQDTDLTETVESGKDSPSKLSRVGSNNDTSMTSFPSSNNSILPEWKKYRDRQFEDLTVYELKEVFTLYQKLTG